VTQSCGVHVEVGVDFVGPVGSYIPFAVLCSAYYPLTVEDPD
jgi:hypothetical protein